MLTEYKYLYETHMHTSNSSACGSNTGVEMAKAAKEKGYAGIFITDHNWYGNNCINPNLEWKEWVHQFCEGYRLAKAWGDENNFDVFFGYEAGYNGTEFLIYGVDEKWLVSHKEIKDASVEEQYRLIHEAGGMVIHAHPYREEDYIPEVRLFPKYVDGVEAINATHSNKLSKSHNNPNFDTLAIKYGKKYSFPMTAGSDVHSTTLFGGGVAFKTKLNSVKDYCERILSKRDYALTNGEYTITIEELENKQLSN